jgi:hypothetical protein
MLFTTLLKEMAYSLGLELCEAWFCHLRFNRLLVGGVTPH